jgi:hypothetical protein
MLEESKLQVFGSILYFYMSSSLLILYNKWLFVSYGFKYPLRQSTVSYCKCNEHVSNVFVFSVTSVHMFLSFIVISCYVR